MSSCICSNDIIKCSIGNYGKSCPTDEYVFCWYTVKGIGRIMYIVFNCRNASGNSGFHLYRDETDTGDVRREYDVKISTEVPVLLLPLNLQFFAEGEGGEKTEEPTSKKLDDARKEGQVAKSKEIANGFGLLALFLILKLWVGNMGINFLETFSYVYGKIPEVSRLVGNPIPRLDLISILKNTIIIMAKITWPILLIGVIIAFLSDYVQVKWKPTAKPLQPKFSKLDPIKGFKKIISANSLVELVKSILKIFVIFYVSYSYLKDKQGQIYILYGLELMPALALIGQVVTDLGIRISVVYMIVAFADFIYQKLKFKKDMKMTKQEVKEEYKNTEGNPEIKGKIRSKMREASQRRMMQSLPEADVVITNPTHYAVAVKYDPEVSPAPIVIAKGEDYLAQKIKEVAKEHSIEIVENKPLARMLYANVEIGEQIPPELYQAVAEVLAFVYHLKGKI